MIELAEENNLFDYSIYNEYIQMKKTLEKLYFLNAILGSVSNYYQYVSRGVERSIIDLMKYHKFKVNLENYSSSKIDEEKLEEVIC